MADLALHSSHGDCSKAGGTRASSPPPVALGPGVAVTALVWWVVLACSASGQVPQTADASQAVRPSSTAAAAAGGGPTLAKEPEDGNVNRDPAPDYQAIRNGLRATLSSLDELREAKTTRAADAGLPEEEIGVIQASLASTLSALGQLKRDLAGDPQTAATDPAAAASEEAETGVTSRPMEMEDQPIGSLTTNIRCSEGDLPADMSAMKFGAQVALPAEALAARQWPGLLYEWESPALCHRPLYFEEENLERYGYAPRRNWIFQPAISGGRFVATVVALPYMMTLRPPCECVYTLGYYRPGSCVPFQARLLELNAKAAAVEAAAVTGLIFAIP